MTTQTGAEQSSNNHQSMDRKWVFSSQIWLLAGGAAVLAGLVLNWDWLTAAGLAPVILGVLPCVAMCALGMHENWSRAGLFA